MQRTVRSVKNSLKFKAQSKPGIVSVRVGTRKFTVPIDARVLKSEDYVFLSFPACSELFEVKDGELVAMPPEADASDAYMALNPGERRGRKRNANSALPLQLAEALKSVPPEFKIGYDSSGRPRLVRKRRRGN